MKTLVLIDLSAIFWAAWHATADRELSEAFNITVGKVHQLASGDYCAVCCDRPPYTWRKALLPTYKAQREAAPEAAREQLRRVKERLVADGFLLWEVDGYEADDVIATACAYAAREEEPLAVTIASADKDLCQLVSDTVTIVSTTDGAVRGPAEVLSKFGVEPHRMRDWLALVGDKSDNIPGIPGVGPVRAAELLKQFGSLAAILSGHERIEKPATRESIRLNGEAARLGYLLVGLETDVPIDFDAVFEKREQKPLVAPEPADESPTADDFDDEPAPATPVSQQAPIAPVAPPPAPEPRALVTTGSAELALPSTVTRAPFELSLQPRSMRDVIALAGGIVNSRLYSKFANKDAVITVILRGREMGLTMMQSLDVFHVVEGKPTLSAHVIIERARNHPDCEYFCFKGGDDTFAEWECKHRRNPTPTKLRYTIEQAQRAGVVKPNGNWAKRPDEMLRKTCGVQLARIDFPSAALGLYAVEELSEDRSAA